MLFLEIIRLYGLRIKIEHSFNQAVRLIGSFAYHFWMQDMKPLRRRNGNQYLHREMLEYHEAVKPKLRAYHVFMQAGSAIATGERKLRYRTRNISRQAPRVNRGQTTFYLTGKRGLSPIWSYHMNNVSKPIYLADRSAGRDRADRVRQRHTKRQ